MPNLTSELTERDLKLFKLLSDFGVISTVQLSKWIFPKVARTTALRRLRLLEKRGLIRKRGTLPDATAVWMIDQKGQRLIAGMTENLYFPAHQLEHEITLNEIRWRLHGLGVVQSWMNERELRRKAPDRNGFERENLAIPDAVILMKHFGRPEAFVRLEVELNLKSNERYKRLFRRTDPYSQGTRAWIWYLVKSRSMGNRILRYAKKHADYSLPPVLGFTVIDDFLTDPWSAEFHQLEKATTLATVMKLSRPESAVKNTHAHASAHALSTGGLNGNAVSAA
ncbi:MAG TPA: hypothetical protein DCS07_00075 [Bdellovibrionales bacterium]|nr:MAG: hypothetical protein A2Z97_01030 [Bdellovibrionales bacterium GWB1_52_6]OFZ03108.1 MAG: hypothetical protein A2X97_09730 [Bdellovibrionales bacterium GWA1_52_35]OFZ41325.1 MAG: hypothetical protein A2070_09045 [Bdellovibrionales bacterium GWC1_52_8]HAR41029.1 hypothetical protein [Bdellovibrionales bacterium]HCM40436.1 hypothetical protein [Bdellovibrionales bacterium]